MRKYPVCRIDRYPGFPVHTKLVQVDFSCPQVLVSEHFLRPVRVVKVRGHEVAQAVGGKMSNPRPRAEVAHEEFDFVACAGVCRSRLGIRENIRLSTGPLPVQLFQQLVVGGLEVVEFGHEQIAKVIRRVGGLEAVARRVFSVVSVIRRVGGLEALARPCRSALNVIRRVGGLEVHGSEPPLYGLVIRRVGGLEVYRIRHTCIPFVIRRVGGLEDQHHEGHAPRLVIRRVGGLEVFAIPILSVVPVIRRVGGLEGIAGDRAVVRKVIRRVGGLEVSGRTPSHFIGITPFRGQLPTTPKEKRRPTSK